MSNVRARCHNGIDGPERASCAGSRCHLGLSAPQLLYRPGPRPLEQVTERVAAPLAGVNPVLFCLRVSIYDSSIEREYNLCCVGDVRQYDCVNTHGRTPRRRERFIRIVEEWSTQQHGNTTQRNPAPVFSTVKHSIRVERCSAKILKFRTLCSTPRKTPTLLTRSAG